MSTPSPRALPGSAPTVMPAPPTLPPGTQAFSEEQKQYLAGLLAGIAQRQLYPYVGRLAGPDTLTADPAHGGPNLAAPVPEPAEETLFGTPISEVTKQELWKRELHGLDAWDRLLEHAEANRFPEDADNFRFRYHGLFHVAPAQNSFMLRCRIPAGELTSAQLAGLAGIADDFAKGKAALTTRSNFQIREIPPRHLVAVLVRLHSLGLTSKGAGADNVRNITASPTAGLDPQELLDVRPFAHALHHYILNQRDLYDLPRKFNVAFEGGGAIDTVADTNDIGFMAVRYREPAAAPSPEITSSASSAPNLQPTPARSETSAPPSDVFFRIELCGISGHKQLATDAGVLVRPSESVAVAAAMLRVFIRHGDRTDRKKARLKYLVDSWGIPKFLAETEKHLAFPLRRVPLAACEARPPAVKHGHIGVYRQKQPAKNYLGVVVPVGVLTSRQMRRLAELAANYGTGQLRLTPWQNLILADLPDGFVETVKRQLVRIGLHHSATAVTGGLVACTGNAGCKWAATDTKGQAVALARHLEKRITLDRPINIHLTGCPNSCAQHYVGDIGLQGVKVGPAGATVEGYNLVFGGGTGAESGIGQQVFTGIAFGEVPALLERVLQVYLVRRNTGETFAAFTRRHDLRQLQELFSA